MALAPLPIRRRSEPMIALINIVFLMLVFFLVAAAIAPPLERGVDLVEAERIEGRAPPDAAVIRADGTMIYRGAEITSEAYLAARLSEASGSVTLRLVPRPGTSGGTACRHSGRASPWGRRRDLDRHGTGGGMTRRGWTIAGIAGALSALLHAGGLIALSPAEPQALAGGPAQLAMIGNSFEDAVAGSVTGATEAEAVAPTEGVTAPEPIRPSPVAERIAAVALPPAPIPPAPSVSSASPVAAPVVVNAAPVVAPATRVAPAETTVVQSSPAMPEAAVAPRPETVTARDAPDCPHTRCRDTAPAAAARRKDRTSADTASHAAGPPGQRRRDGARRRCAGRGTGQCDPHAGGRRRAIGPRWTGRCGLPAVGEPPSVAPAQAELPLRRGGRGRLFHRRERRPCGPVDRALVWQCRVRPARACAYPACGTLSAPACRGAAQFQCCRAGTLTHHASDRATVS